MAQVRVRKRGKTFSYIFEAGKTSDGRRKVVEKGGFPTKSAAYDAGVAAYNDFKHGNIGITSESITLKDFMTAWLENVAANNVKPLTLHSYQCLSKNYIAPHIGNVKIQDLTPAILDSWLRELRRGGFSYNTISAVYRLLHHALNHAVYPLQLIASNPSSYIKVPRNAPKNIVKRHIISLERFNALLEKYPFGSPMYIPLLLLYHTGMRIGEVLGLTWDDVNFDEKKITVHQQMIFLQTRGNFLATLKSESSNRSIFVDDFLIGELQRWQINQSEREQNLNGRYNYREDNGHIICQSKALPLSDVSRVNLVCTKVNGEMFSRARVTRILSDENLNAHSFRHTHATQLIESGASPKGVAGRLGHANTAITQNLYTHNTRKLQEDTAQIFFVLRRGTAIRS